MSFLELLGYAAVVVNIGVYAMRRMIPLRLVAILSNLMFSSYAFLADVKPTLVLNCILLPLNIYRLIEMLLLTKRARMAATHQSFDLNFLRPYATAKTYGSGETVFSKGDRADAMYLVEKGKFVLPESSIELSSGALVGELGLLSPNGARTQSLVSQGDGKLLVLSYERFRELFFQNPTFGYYFLKLTTGRLFENIDTMQRKLQAQEILKPSGQPAIG